ncbi:MAG: M6 family metalloprotease domain-containing protein [Bacteroidetes bacterium]|nr:M6 family metalloprotease domain-containing protein [Bacteroidota bacterium]MCL1968943.1 M6 family metalloprotease domain-containing protein [Bacteroidota bacterium]
MNKKKPKSFILLAILLMATSFLYAIPAIPTPIVFTQPDGTHLTVMVRGDERIHWHETMDGYTLLYNQEHFLTYAQLDEAGNLQPTDFIATDIENRDIETLFFLNTIVKKLFFSDVQKQVMLQVWDIEDKFAAQHELQEGSLRSVQYKTICAFVQFPEKAMIKAIADFDPLFNQLGYTGSGVYGSVRDYFKESSYDQFDLLITLCGIYTAPQSESYYAGPAGNGTLHVDELARWTALQVAAEPTINFVEYDSNNDGKVDGFHFIFAGIGQETGSCSTCIWSHKYQFNPPVTQNGKSISIYSCSPELRTINGNAITTIGVIAHEMSHAFGAYDFYDTDYNGSGGTYPGTGDWDIMANGSYNGSPEGSRPPHHNTFTKIQYGWVTPIVLNSYTTVTNMPNSTENPVAYRINTTYPNEYYLLENRQKNKFNTTVPGAGLLIWHVHAQVNQGGMQNCVNCMHPQKMYPVCASRNTQMPTSSPSSYGNINSGGCPFPGTSNKTSFTDETTPAMKSWNGANTGKPITKITHANQLISFVFMEPVTNYTITATCEANGSISPAGVTTIAEGGSQEYTITPNANYDRKEVLINGTNNPSAVTSGKYMFTNVQSNQTIHATFAPQIYQVTFNANGGTNTMEPQSFVFGEYQKLNPNGFIKTECHFENWNTKADGSGTYYENEQSISITANMLLFAQWKENTGIDEWANNDSPIHIIPNPANNYIDLQISSAGQASGIDFYNAFGQLVKSEPYHGEEHNGAITQRVSIIDLSQGIYLVKIGTATAKLVVY